MDHYPSESAACIQPASENMGSLLLTRVDHRGVRRNALRLRSDSSQADSRRCRICAPARGGSDASAQGICRWPAPSFDIKIDWSVLILRFPTRRAADVFAIPTARPAPTRRSRRRSATPMRRAAVGRAKDQPDAARHSCHRVIGTDGKLMATRAAASRPSSGCWILKCK